MVPWELEDWLADAADAVVQRTTLKGYDALDARERLLYELWLFDAETLNGGVSQYFCNTESDRWPSLLALSANSSLLAFSQFAVQVQQVLAGAKDAYQAVINSKVDLDDAYEGCRSQVISELRASIGNTI